MEEFKFSQPGNFETGKLTDFYLFVLLMSLRSVLKSSFLDFQKEQLNPLLIENDDGETVFNDSVSKEENDAAFETKTEYSKFGFAFLTQKEYQKYIQDLSNKPAPFVEVELMTKNCTLFLLSFLENVDPVSDKELARRYFEKVTNQQLFYLSQFNDNQLFRLDEHDFYQAYTPVMLKDPEIQDKAPFVFNFTKTHALFFYKSILASLETQK